MQDLNENQRKGKAFSICHIYFQTPDQILINLSLVSVRLWTCHQPLFNCLIPSKQLNKPTMFQLITQRYTASYTFYSVYVILRVSTLIKNHKNCILLRVPKLSTVKKILFTVLLDIWLSSSRIIFILYFSDNFSQKIISEPNLNEIDPRFFCLREKIISYLRAEKKNFSIPFQSPQRTQ